MDIIEFMVSIATIVSSIYAVKLFLITRRINEAQFEMMKNSILPNFKVISVKSDKHESNSTIYDGTYCYIHCKTTSTVNCEIPNFVKEELGKSENLEKFFSEIEFQMKQVNYQGIVYFTYFENRYFLVLNCGTNKNDYTIAHCNVKLVLKNFGTTVSAISIESFTIFFKKEIGRKKRVKGDSEAKILLSEKDNEECIIFFDEVTTELVGTLCQIQKGIYQTLPPSIDLLRLHMSENFLNYYKLELVLFCWDMYENKRKFKITLMYNQKTGYFVSSTSLL